ncbi:hypothetical protein PMI04_006415 [Sphingobium sp. AP49]|uniref:hypothetical protein n=1 Tax=Sphingobium sp. AP49 TaxID=1144307 RepID=UPI0002EAC39D|nr:hypothetical protein [Sphingobium sp. AP49]WHO40223.1 hypothetical protein PMI04_006415 [Sphingobium sp. AP49]
MMYKVFAGGTLVVAPMIVLALQNFTPHSAAADAQDNSAIVAPTPTTPAAPTVVVPSAPPAFVPPDLSQPMGDAGQPSLNPAAGLPAPSDSASASGTPAPGSPNAEP